MRIVRYLILWASFIILYTVAAVCLERIEGYKIITTEYYGLRNIGFVFPVIMFLFATIFYPIILIPLTILITKILPFVLGRILLYSLLGGIGGILIFRNLYNERFVQGYDLNISSSILIFGTVGLMYALIDHYLQRRDSGK